MKLAILYNEHKFSGKLTKFFTGSYAYHTAWVDEENEIMYDMSLINRRRTWPHYHPPATWKFYDFPEVTREYLEYQLTHDNNTYGVIDYCMFLIRPIFHLVGKSTINAGGIICSEKINIDLWNCGVVTPFKITDEPPSPADLDKMSMSLGR